MAGKSSLANRITNNTFSQDYKSTIGIKIFKKVFVLANGDAFEAMIWDIFGGINAIHNYNHYYKGAHAIILVNDVQNESTLEKIPSYQASIKAESPSAKLILAYNKIDLFDPLELEKFKRLNYKEEKNLAVKYVSAKSAAGVKDLFLGVIELCLTQTNTVQTI